MSKKNFLDPKRAREGGRTGRDEPDAQEPERALVDCRDARRRATRAGDGCGQNAFRPAARNQPRRLDGRDPSGNHEGSFENAVLSSSPVESSSNLVGSKGLKGIENYLKIF